MLLAAVAFRQHAMPPNAGCLKAMQGNMKTEQRRSLSRLGGNDRIVQPEVGYKATLTDLLKHSTTRWRETSDREPNAMRFLKWILTEAVTIMHPVDRHLAVVWEPHSVTCINNNRRDALVEMSRCQRGCVHIALSLDIGSPLDDLTTSSCNGKRSRVTGSKSWACGRHH